MFEKRTLSNFDFFHVIAKICYLPKLSGGVYQTYSHQKSWKVGQKIQFACPKGYKLKGSAYAVCGEDGHWGNQPPVCVKSKYVTYAITPRIESH